MHIYWISLYYISWSHLATLSLLCAILSLWKVYFSYSGDKSDSEQKGWWFLRGTTWYYFHSEEWSF